MLSRWLSTFAVLLVTFIIVMLTPSSGHYHDEEQEWEENIPFQSTITEEYADPCKAGKFDFSL